VKFSTRQITIAGVLGSVTIALGLLPVGGFIPVPTPAGAATTMHIPTILAGILEGPVIGGIVGAIFGAFSFWKAQAEVNPIAKMMFTNPAIAFLPRILIGVVSYQVYRLAQGKRGSLVLAGITGVILGHTGYYSVKGNVQTRLYVAFLLAALGIFLVMLINRRFPRPGPALGAVAGSLTNTVGVLGLSVVLGYLPVQAAAAIAVMHGIPEALVALVLSDLVYRGTARFLKVD